jgi:hypothetical protein
MRPKVLVCFLFAAVALPTVGTAQVYRFATPPPLVTAADALWQRSGQPIFYAGSFYYPAGATVFFDGNVMTRTGIFEGVPLYQDVTLEPFSIIYVPVGGAVMRPYERRRQGELAGTVGSRTPSFPIQRDVELSAYFGRPGVQTPAIFTGDRLTLAERGDALVQVPLRVLEELLLERLRGTTGSGAPSVPASSPAPPDQPTGVESVPRPESSAGVWIEYEGGRWYNAGAAVVYDPQRFEPVGSYRGVPVYRERGGPSDRIFVTVVPDGPLAPFARR